jgi:hypothetical protein
MGLFLMADKINTEILPPDGGLVWMWRWRVQPKTARIIKVAATIPAIGCAAWLLQNFLQLRGVVNLMASRIDLSFLTLCILFVAYVVTEGSQQKLKWRLILSAAIVLLAIAVDRLTPMPTITSIPVASAPIDIPTVEVRYSQGMLPFFVVPNSCVYLLELNRKIPYWPDQICVSGDDRKRKIPQGFPGGRYAPTDDYAICEIKNHSDKDLVNARIEFNVSFRTVKRVPVTHTYNKNKTESMTVPTRTGAKLGSGFTWSTYDPRTKKATGFTEGQEILKQRRVVILPSISAHGEGFVYLVNVSHYITRFDLPTKIMAIVSGSPQQQVLTLIRPQIGMFDVSPFWGLSPVMYKWPGVPDDSQ